MNNIKQFKRVVSLFIFLICSLVLSSQVLSQDIPGEKLWPGSVNSNDTWLIATNTQRAIPERSMAVDDSDFDWADDKTEQNTTTVETGIPLIQGAKPIDPEDTMYSGLFSEQNYLSEQSVAKVKRFYLDQSGKYCSIDDESPMAFEEGELMMTYIHCLNHAGDAKAGDKVTVITIFKAPAPILSDLIGRTQGDWTIISIDSWVEEDN